MTYDPYRNQAPYVASPAQPFQPADQYFAVPPPPEPPRRTNVALVVVVSVLGTILAVFLFFCALGVFGAVLSDNASDQTSASPTPAQKSPSPSATPSNTAQLVQPSGAPYSYRVPAGFTTTPPPTSTATPEPSTSSAGADEPPSEYNVSAVTTPGSSAYDYISVASFTVKQDTGESNEAALGTQLDKWIQASGSDPSTRANLRIGNHLAFKYTFAEGARGAYDYFVFNGRTGIDVVCAWSSDQTQVQRGCQDLLDTLQVTAS